MAVLDEMTLMQTGCLYNHRGVVCTNRNCAECGWNPVVEEKRKQKVIEKYGEVLKKYKRRYA